jgi:hypothetical protein
MHPTAEQIAEAAYHRWERRGGGHGGDRDDWVAAEKDLRFGLNYRYVARYALAGPTVLLGKDGAPGRRLCRFCEQSAPAATFSGPPALPRLVGNAALVAWDECDDCRAHCDAHLAGAFEAFARPWLAGPPGGPPPGAGVPVAAWKALVRMALSVLPGDELHHFDDTAEWVANPDHDRDAVLLRGLGCHVYHTPAPVASPFAAVARRVDDAPWPYMLFFLGASRAVFQTHLPFCPRDEDLEDDGVRGPELSMSLGPGPALRASTCAFLPVMAAVAPARAVVSALGSR